MSRGRPCRLPASRFQLCRLGVCDFPLHVVGEPMDLPKTRPEYATEGSASVERGNTYLRRYKNGIMSMFVERVRVVALLG